jgi:hypothetical protein
MAANDMEEASQVTAAQRTQTMGHNQFSRIFQVSFVAGLFVQCIN